MMLRTVLVVAVSAMFLPSPGSAGPNDTVKKRVRARPASARLNLSKLTLSKSKTAKPLPARMRKDIARLGRKKAVVPRPLPRAERRRVIAHFRQLARTQGIALVNAVVSIPEPPAQIALTPDKPVVGQSSLGVRVGDAAPLGFSTNDPAPALDVRQYGYYVAHFTPLEVGAMYVLDCTVTNYYKRNWLIQGPTNVNVVPQQGHILSAFVATESTARFYIHPDDIGQARLYRCELIRAG